MKKLLLILLIIPVVSFSQTIHQEDQTSNKPELSYSNTIAHQIEELENKFLPAVQLQTATNVPVLLDSTRTYSFKSAYDSILTNRTLFFYHPTGILKMKSDFFWNDYLKKMLNNKYEYIFNRSNQLITLTYTDWQVSHIDAYTSADSIYHPEVNDTYNYLQKFQYTYDALKNQTSAVHYNYSNPSNSWFMSKNFQYYYNTDGLKTVMLSMALDASQLNIKEEYAYDEKKNLTMILTYGQSSNKWYNIGKTKYDYTYDSTGMVTALLVSYWSSKVNEWKNISRVDYSYKANKLLDSRIYAIMDTTRNALIPANRTDFKYNKIDKVLLRHDFAWNKTSNQWELRKKQYYYYNYSDPVTTSEGMGFISETPFKIYPNPARAILWIENTTNYNSTISIYDNKGTHVHRDLIKKGINKINVSSLPKGIYIITLPFKNIPVSHKIIIE